MRFFTCLILGLLLNLCLLTVSVQGQITRFVSTTGTATDPASATSWATSTTNLQGAIDVVGASLQGGQVWVAAGVYTPTTTTGPSSRTISFSMRNNVVIYGGFAGTETSLGQRAAVNPVNNTPSSSTLSGEIGDPTSTTDNSFHVINNPNSLSLTSTAIMDGFVVTGGRADGIGLYASGGAVNNIGSSSGGSCDPSFRNCMFINNSASSGGAIANNGTNNGNSSPLLVNCSFLNNSAQLGGAIWNNGDINGRSNPQLTNCLFQSNSATSAGGVMYNNAGTGGSTSPQLVDCSFQSNSANTGGALFNNGALGGNSNPQLGNCSFVNNLAYFGGAIYNDRGINNNSSRSQLINCLFQGNSASNFGGAMYNNGAISNNSSPLLTDCSFQSNSALQGGAMYNGGAGGNSNPELINCSFQSNSASTLGGAIYNNGAVGGSSSPRLTNCAFVNNLASSGGAIYNDGATGTSSPQMTNCSFQSNSATTGGAMYNDGFSSNSRVVLTNCILFGNGLANAIIKTGPSTSISATYSLLELPVGDIDISGPGNLTTTTSPFASGNSVALIPCSPAINAGTNSATGLAGITTDLVGNPRIIDGRVDMGAVEFQNPLLPGAVLSLQADESGCPMRLVGQATGNSFVFTGPGSYVFSNVYRVGGTYSVFAEGIKQPGVYTLNATNTNACGSSTPVSQTVTVSRSCP